MADVSVTPGDVHITNTTRYRKAIYGTTVTEGQVLYYLTTDGEWYLADANNTLVTAGKDGIGIALTPGTDGVAGIIAIAGLYDSGSSGTGSGAVTEGTVYVVSDTPGGIKPHADLASGDNVTIIGVGCPNFEIDLTPLYASGQTVP